MSIREHFERNHRMAYRAACLGVILAIALVAQCFAQPLDRNSHRALPKPSESPSRPAVPATAREHLRIKNYFLDFDGDHSLDVATVIEQPAAGFTRYTVQLHLASGAEQSLEVAAPPGGLQVEMHDMTGDKVANDVVLRPALVRWLPTILVNDGHEHFEVAVSASDPRTFSSSGDLGSRRRESQTFALLTTSGFEYVHLLNSRGLPGPQLQQGSVFSLHQMVTTVLGYRSSSERAPPIAVTI
jgi:hypothetical protein